MGDMLWFCACRVLRNRCVRVASRWLRRDIGPNRGPTVVDSAKHRERDGSKPRPGTHGVGVTRQNARSGSFHQSARLHVLLLAIGTAILWLREGIERSPILWDHAYFTVLSQGILHGRPIYSTSFMGYPPLALMVSSAAMVVGNWLNVPTYLAPRYLAVVIGISAVVAIYAITRRATGSAMAGIAAAVILGSFRILSSSALATLEPKLLVLTLGLFAGLAIQRHSWWCAGTLSSLAASCWQPAGIIPLACGAVAIFESRGRLAGPLSSHPAARYAVGLAVGALPALAYLAFTNAWVDFWTHSVLIPSQWQLPLAGNTPLRWLRVAAREFRGETLSFALAALSIGAFAGRALAGWEGDRVAAWLGARQGALPVLTLLWAGFNSVEFQHAPDMLPFLPCVAFWIAWAISRGAKVVPPTGRNRVVALVVVVLAIQGYANGPRRGSLWTLAAQRRLVNEVLTNAAPTDRVFAFTAEEIYALSERRRPPLSPLTDSFMPFLSEIEPLGCQGVLERIVRERPIVVVVGIWRRSSDCERGLPKRLVDHGYRERRERLRMGPPIWRILERRGDPMPSVVSGSDWGAGTTYAFPADVF